MNSVRVDLSSTGDLSQDRSYEISIQRGLLPSVGEKLSALGLSGKCAVVTNPKVGSLYLDKVQKSLSASGFNPISIEIPDGEQYKSLATAESVLDRLVEERFERKSIVLALGGGVVGDLAGFVASVYLRGVPYVQIPTTLLSQVDSSVGGKTAVNHTTGKNLIGAFYQPKAVFIDPDVLSTLDEREVRAGLAEVIKYGIIKDEEFFAFLEKSGRELLNSSSDVLVKAIAKSCEVKAMVVSEDERESGLRAILNFGHTFGHAIEALTSYKKYLHGEAISIGMVLASEFSVHKGLCPKTSSDRVKDLLLNLGLETEFSGLSADDMVSAMFHDKKVSGGEIKAILMNDIGSVDLFSLSGEEIKDFLAKKQP